MITAFNQDVRVPGGDAPPLAASLFASLPPVDSGVVDVPVHADATDTEIVAPGTIAPVAGTLHALVLRWITDARDDGATGKELGQQYARSIGRDANDGSARYSVMPRCTELRNAGLIRDSGLRRGGPIVWVAVNRQA